MDIVCLPEFSAALFEDNRWHGEPIPGPATEAFAEIARRDNTYVIVPMVEQAEDGNLYNTCVLLDRQGHVAGRYRKTHPAPGEAEQNRTSAGDEIPVFRTDFATIGVATCMDIHFPELFTTLALEGAEIIFWPTASMDYTGDLMESLVNARAIDNQVYFVCSHYVQERYLVGKHYGRSRVVDPMGRIRADTGHFPGVAVAEVDLDQTYPMGYEDEDLLKANPTMRQIFFQARRPELYRRLVEPVTETHWNRSKRQ